MKLKSKTKVRGKPIREIKHSSSGKVEERFTWVRDREDTKVFQFVWEMGRLVHVHCKRCGNEWKAEFNVPIETYFEITDRYCKCLKCGRIGELG